MTSTLLLGGPKFLGRAIADAALARGHELTLFNRGLTNPEEHPEVEKLRGDRDGDLRALEGRRCDLAIDTNGFVPRVVRTGAGTLVNAIEHYTFVSSTPSTPTSRSPCTRSRRRPSWRSRSARTWPRTTGR